GGLTPMQARVRRWWPLALVLLAFALAGGLLVPWRAPVALTDDWLYARAVQRLVVQHRLHVDGLTVTTLVFQVVWGAAFSQIVGFSFASARLSTAVLFLASGP